MLYLRRFLLAVGAGLLLSIAPSAEAAFPGENGRISFMNLPFPAEGIDEEIFDIRSDGSGLRNLTNNPAQDFHASYSPDGRHIVFSTFRDAGNAQDDVRNHAEIYVMKADGSDPRRITFNRLPEKTPAWSADGKQLIFWRSAPVTTVGDPLPPGDLWILDPRTGQQRNLTKTPNANELDPQWSPDGNRIAFDSDAGEPDKPDVYTIRPDGRELSRLTRGPDLNFHPSYSPDGRRITFTSEHDGNADIFLMRANGTHKIQLTDDPRYEYFSCFSPNGRFIAYSSEVGGDPFPGDEGFFFDDIFRMRPDGREQANLTRSPGLEEFRPDWQPLPEHR
jgi:TolB protein